MAPRGRKPTPPQLKVLTGRGPGRDSGGRPIADPPAFVRAAPEPPEWLGVEAQAEWQRVVPELERLKLVKLPSRSSLASYCEMWETFVLATADVHAHGMTRERVTTRKDGTVVEEPVPNPAIVVQRNAQRELRAWASEYGLTPSSESRVKVPDGEEGDDLLDGSG